MGVPQGQGDWVAAVHDYNYSANGLKFGTNFNPFISRETYHALIDSNEQLYRNAGGVQGVKMGVLFGILNTLQILTHF